MTPEFVIQILRQALMMAFWLAAPLLAVGFAAGIVIVAIAVCSWLYWVRQSFSACFHRDSIHRYLR